MRFNVNEQCECRHARGYHYYGFGRCTVCRYSCWWFRLKRQAWMLVRFACGCSGNRDSKAELATLCCSRPEHDGAVGVEIVS